MLDDSLHDIYAPLAADVLIARLDESYKSGHLGSNSVEANWEACVARSEDEDSVTMATRVIDAYLEKLNNPEINKDNLWTIANHVNTVNHKNSWAL